LIEVQNGQVNAQSIAALGNDLRDVYIADFSVAQFSGVSSPGSVCCEPGQSSGTICL
jgi:hypothetical protein